MASELHPTAARMAERLRARGLDVEVVTLDSSTRSAADAATAIGCDVAQIVKSLVFISGGGPILCLCAGDRRVDPARLGDGARPASPDEVREATGFAIGGVPPLGHDAQLETVVDASLRRFETVWAAAGTPRSVFAVRTADLLDALDGADVRAVSA